MAGHATQEKLRKACTVFVEIPEGKILRQRCKDNIKKIKGHGSVDRIWLAEVKIQLRAFMNTRTKL